MIFRFIRSRELLEASNLLVEAAPLEQPLQHVNHPFLPAREVVLPWCSWF
jgi:hypothetical protein